MLRKATQSSLAVRVRGRQKTGSVESRALGVSNGKAVEFYEYFDTAWSLSAAG